MEGLGIQLCIHILDCTKLLVNQANDNYENPFVVKIDGEAIRGYKLGVLRSVLDDSGIAQEIEGRLQTMCNLSQNIIEEKRKRAIERIIKPELFTAV